MKINDFSRIYLLVPFFMDGGVERWINQVCTVLPNDKVILVITGKVKYRNSLPLGVRVVEKKKLESYDFFNLEHLNENDLVISSLTPSNILGVLLKVRFRCKLVTSLHVTLVKQEFESYVKYYVRKLIYNTLALVSDALITVSEGLREEIFFKKNVVTIYNPIVDEVYIRDYKTPAPHRKNIIMGCGRLGYQKGFERLIKAIGVLNKDHCISEGFELMIVGEGTEEIELKQLAADLGVSDIIRFIPFNDDIFHYYEMSKVFVLSSRYEGFGNVLAEALSAGCFCVSFDIPHGPKEILDSGKYGELVEDGDIDGLADAIKKGLRGNIDLNLDINRLEHCKKFTTSTFKNSLTDLDF